MKFDADIMIVPWGSQNIDWKYTSRMESPATCSGNELAPQSEGY